MRRVAMLGMTKDVHAEAVAARITSLDEDLPALLSASASCATKMRRVAGVAGAMESLQQHAESLGRDDPQRARAQATVARAEAALAGVRRACFATDTQRAAVLGKADAALRYAEQANHLAHSFLAKGRCREAAALVPYIRGAEVTAAALYAYVGELGDGRAVPSQQPLPDLAPCFRTPPPLTRRQVAARLLPRERILEIEGARPRKRRRRS